MKLSHHHIHGACVLGRVTVSVTMNATGVVEGDVIIDVDAGTGSTSSSAAGFVTVIGAPAIVQALGVGKDSVNGLVAAPDGPERLTLTFSLDPANPSPQPRPVGSAPPGPADVNMSYVGPSGLSDDMIVGRLVVSLKPWASQVTVQRSAGTAPNFYSLPGEPRCLQACH